jgi:hypothetical protein
MSCTFIPLLTNPYVFFFGFFCCCLTLNANASSSHVYRVDDRTVRYIAEENIKVEQPDEVRELMELAGRHFKRWDRESRTFISNIRDEYPDD